MNRNLSQENPQGLEPLARQAQDCALHMMRTTGSVLPTVIADTDEGSVFWMPSELTPPRTDHEPPHSICIAHNLLHILKATLKTEEGIEDIKVIEAYHKKLDVREAASKKAGRVFSRALYQALYRPTEVSLQLIRWIRFSLQRAAGYKDAIALLRPLMIKYL